MIKIKILSESNTSGCIAEAAQSVPRRLEKKLGHWLGEHSDAEIIRIECAPQFAASIWGTAIIMTATIVYRER